MNLLSDLRTYWRLRKAEDAVASAKYQAEWETAEWNTFFEPEGVVFPNQDKQSRSGHHHDEDSLKSIRQRALEGLNEAYEAGLKNSDSIEAVATQERTRARFFQADRNLAALHAARAYYYGRMQTAKRELDDCRDDVARREQAKLRIRSYFTLPRVRRRRRPRERLTRGEKLAILGILIGIVAIGVTFLGLWLSGTV